MAESGVILPVDSTGKALRTTPVTTTFTTGAGGTVHQQVVTTAAVDGSVQEITPFGAGHIENPSHLILADQFNGGTIDTAQWATTGSTVAPTQANGSVTLAPGTTASAVSLLGGLPALPMQFVSQFAIRADFGATQPTNNHRFIGLATGNTTAASPIIDGVGFEMTTGGVFRAVIYANSAVVASATLATPTTANVYLMLVKPGWVAFYVGSFSNPVAVLTGFSPANELLPVRVHSINATTAATAAPTLVVGGLAVSDGGENSMGVGDGVYPWRKATIKAASTTAAATDTGLVVAVHPSSPLPAGTNVIGMVNEQPSTLMVSTTAAISVAATATLPAAGAGLFHYITGIEIQRYAGAALTGAAAPIVVTTTNLPGSLAWSFDTAAAIGTSQIQLLSFAGNPLKSSAANTATTIVAPLTTSVIWRINVSYYTAA